MAHTAPRLSPLALHRTRFGAKARRKNLSYVFTIQPEIRPVGNSGATAVNRKPDTPTVTEIKGKVAAFIEDRKQANSLVDVIGYLGQFKVSSKLQKNMLQ
jgi:hypothetical protein